MTIDHIRGREKSFNQLTNALSQFQIVEPRHLKDEINKLEDCFANYSPTCEGYNDTFFALTKEEFDEINAIRSIEDLTDKVRNSIDHDKPIEEQYLTIYSLFNKVIYFQYKLNILRELKNKTSEQDQRFIQKYLVLLDKRYDLSESIKARGIISKFGGFGKPSLTRSP